MTLLFKKVNFVVILLLFWGVKITNYKLGNFVDITSSRNAWLAAYYIPPANQKVVSVENDAG